MLADATGKDDAVRAPERRRERGSVPGGLERKEVERFRGLGGIGCKQSRDIGGNAPTIRLPIRPTNIPVGVTAGNPTRMWDSS
jgi:hypothetical protein